MGGYPMKKIISVLLILLTLLSLASCTEEKYEPVASTEEESRTVMTLWYNNKPYEVKYELYRAFFLTYRDSVDGGDRSVWSSDGKDKYIEEIDRMILDSIIEIYSTLALAESLGIDPYSADVEADIKEYVRISVEGGDMLGASYPGYGSYEAYLAAIKALYLNYSTQTLLFRYSITADLINDYYLGELDEEDIKNGELSVGTLECTEDDVRSFYFSDECVRVLRTFVSEEMDINHKQRAERVREAIAAVADRGESAVRDAMIGNGSTTSVPELEEGFVMGKYNLVSSVYGELTDEAFRIAEGEVGNVVTVHDGSQLLHYILYRAEKSEEHLTKNYASIAYIYLKNTVGLYYKNCADAMRASVSTSELLRGLDRSLITME